MQIIITCTHSTNKMPRINLFKDSDLLNPHMIIFIVDNQPEIDSTVWKETERVCLYLTHGIYTCVNHQFIFTL